MTNTTDTFHFRVSAPFTLEDFPTYQITREVPGDVEQVLGWSEHLEPGVWSMRTLDGKLQQGCSSTCHEIAQRLVEVCGRVEVDHPQG